jgi:hypothetical protein
MQYRERKIPSSPKRPTKYSVEWALILKGPGREFVHSAPFSVEVPLMSSRRRQGHIYTYLGAFAILRKATINFVMSVYLSAWNNQAATRRFFMKFNIWVFFETL